MKRFASLAAISAASLTFATMGHAATFSGIEFDDNAFADAVIDFTLGDGVGGTYDDPDDVLGTPDWNSTAQTGSFSLGRPGQSPDNLPDDQFGSVTVQFTDNSLTTSGNADADLFVFEIGGAVERYMVEISKDNSIWIAVATITGQPSSIDIDSVVGVNAGDKFSYVRVTDVGGGVNSSGPFFAGPDIDAIGAITSTVAVPSVPLPASSLLLLAGLGALGMTRRKTK